MLPLLPDVSLVAGIVFGATAVSRILVVSLTLLKMLAVNILGLIFLAAVSCESASG